MQQEVGLRKWSGHGYPPLRYEQLRTRRGPPRASQDLTDVVELLRADEGRVAAILADAPSAVSPALRRIWKNVRGR